MRTKLKALALAVGSVAFLGLSTQAQAIPSFQARPSAISGSVSTPFTADFVQGSSSELLHITPTQTTGSGFLTLSNFFLNSNAVLPGVSRLNVDYGLYVTFDLVANGAFQNGTQQTLQTLNFKIYADPNLNTTFQQATVTGNTGTEAAVTGITSDDKLVAFGSLVNGIAGVDALGGVFVNATQTFNLCSGSGTALFGATTVSTGVATQCASNIGTQYFFSPSPFYQLAFDEFNNTSPGVTRSTDGTLAAIRNATGGFDFQSVPEPDTIALFGVAAVAAGLSLRRRKAA